MLYKVGKVTGRVVLNHINHADLDTNSFIWLCQTPVSVQKSSGPFLKKIKIKQIMPMLALKFS